MKKVRIKRRESCDGKWFDFGVYKNKKLLLINVNSIWRSKSIATRSAKAMAKRIGIPYDPEIIKQHGC